MPKLHEILAVVQTKTARATRDVTDIHRRTQAETLVTGRSRTYEPRDDDGERLPDESQHVQLVIENVLAAAAAAYTPAFDVVATRDAGNADARADVVVDGTTVLADVPAVTLIYLEKRLADIHTFVAKLPALSPAHRWEHDEGRGFHVATPVVTVSKRRVQKPIELAPATKEHPAQVKLIEVEEPVGDWTVVMHSGALPATRKAELLERVAKLSEAVKVARTKANQVEVAPVEIGERVFGYLFAR